MWNLNKRHVIQFSTHNFRLNTRVWTNNGGFDMPTNAVRLTKQNTSGITIFLLNNLRPNA